jgi:hypothetical protein
MTKGFGAISFEVFNGRHGENGSGQSKTFWSGDFFGDAITPVMILLAWLLTAPFQGRSASGVGDQNSRRQ